MCVGVGNSPARNRPCVERKKTKQRRTTTTGEGKGLKKKEVDSPEVKRQCL